MLEERKECSSCLLEKLLQGYSCYAVWRGFITMHNLCPKQTAALRPTRSKIRWTSRKSAELLQVEAHISTPESPNLTASNYCCLQKAPLQAIHNPLQIQRDRILVKNLSFGTKGTDNLPSLCMLTERRRKFEIPLLLHHKHLPPRYLTTKVWLRCSVKYNKPGDSLSTSEILCEQLAIMLVD